MMREVKMKNTVAYIIITVLALSLIAITPAVHVVKAEATGYLAIKDYLGKTWSISDVQKIINTTVNTPDGPKSLADYFWIVVDDDPQNKKYNLRDFTVSPLDNVTAVLPLPEGDHYVDIYWFGFHQRQLVNIVNSTHYVLNLETAPTLPLKSYGEPPESAEWSLTSHPDGVKLQRKDGKAYVQFVYNQSYIEVYWYDENTGDNYFSVDVIIDSNYNWKFHLTDPAQTYSDEETGTFFGISYTVAKIYEEVKWEQIGEVLHVTYLMSFGENAYAYEAARHAFDAANTWLNDAYWTWISPAAGTIVAIKSFVETLQGVIDNALAVFKPKDKDYLIIYDVFATPTQIVVTAHAYYKDPDTGNLVAKPITSANCFTINNRLVFVKQLSGGGMWFKVDLSEKNFGFFRATDGAGTYTINIGDSYDLAQGTENAYNNVHEDAKLPGGTYFILDVDDMSKYYYTLWLTFKLKKVVEANQNPTVKLYLKISIVFDFEDTGKADIFESNLQSNSMQYSRSGNTISVQLYSSTYTIDVSYGTVIAVIDKENLENIVKLLPSQSKGKIYYTFYGSYMQLSEDLVISDYYDDTYVKIDDYKQFFHMVPKLTPPQISILTNGYQQVSSAFAVQVFTDILRSSNGSYVLSYYILDNEPPPHYLIRDVWYDVENDVAHYVFTIISIDVYGQDIVNITKTYDNETFVNAWYMNIKPTVRAFDQVTFAMVDYDKLAFLNLAPESIEPMFAPPPYPGYGTPTRDWANIETTSFDFNVTRGDRLFYFDNSTYKWVEVRVYSISGTQDFEVKRLSDNVTIEILEVNTISDYYYKWNSSSFSYTGWLYNDDGTLVFVVDSAKWSYTPEEIAAILKKIDIQGLFEQWTETWNQIAQQLGLIASSIGKVGGTSIPWELLLIGGGLVIALLIIIAASKPGVNVVLPPRGFRYSKVGGK